MPADGARGRLCALSLIMSIAWPAIVIPADSEILRPRVPADELDSARAMRSPLTSDAELLEKGKVLYEGKAFCAACHGRDGKGLGEGLDLKGPLPRNFTDPHWQAARSDGELFWILRHGSPGTDMAPFVPLVLSEDEAWQVLLYVRSLSSGKR
jgi:mono/diheme cytochrome c family protein